MYEEWQAREDYEKYIAWRGERGDMEKLMQFVDSSPTVRYFNKA